MKEVHDTVTSSAAKSFGNCKKSRRKLRGVFITHINGTPVFNTKQAEAQFKLLHDQFLQKQTQGVADNFSFEITFSREANLQGTKLKRAIDDYNDLVPGTTKRVKSKDTLDDGDISTDLDDRTSRYPIGFNIYKVFDGVQHKGTISGYDSKHRLYQVEYQDGDSEEFYHNEIHAHEDKLPNIPMFKTKVLNIDAKKRKDIRRKHRT